MCFRKLKLFPIYLCGQPYTRTVPGEELLLVMQSASCKRKARKQ